MSALRQWLRSSDAYDVLDDAVMGSLLSSYVDELCSDFSVTRAEFARALDDALMEGC